MRMRCCNLWRLRATAAERNQSVVTDRTGQDRTGSVLWATPPRDALQLLVLSSCCCDRSVFWHVKWPLSAPLSPRCLFRPCRRQQHWLPFNNIMKTRVLQLIRVAALLAFFALCRALFSLLASFCAVVLSLSASQPASYESSPRHSVARLEVAWGSSSSTAAPSHCGTMQPRASPSAQPQPPQKPEAGKYIRTIEYALIYVYTYMYMYGMCVCVYFHL